MSVRAAMYAVPTRPWIACGVVGLSLLFCGCAADRKNELQPADPGNESAEYLHKLRKADPDFQQWDAHKPVLPADGKDRRE